MDMCHSLFFLETGSELGPSISRLFSVLSVCPLIQLPSWESGHPFFSVMTPLYKFGRGPSGHG